MQELVACIHSHHPPEDVQALITSLDKGVQSDMVQGDK